MNAISANAIFLPVNDLLNISGKHILGVNPPVRDFAFFDLWSKPLGLLYLLQRMRENGNSVALLDSVQAAASGEKTFGRKKTASYEIEKPLIYKNIPRRYRHFGITEDAIVKWLAENQKPDIIFMTSAMTYWYPGVEWIIQLLKRTLPDVPVVLGGTYARLCPDHAAKRGADFIIAEHWQPDVIHPAMDLYGALSYGVTTTSFGCPLTCSYCASRRLWPDYRRRALDEVLGEINFQAKLGASDFAFYDDALLTEKREYFYPLCRKLSLHYGDSLRFHTPNGLHVREIDSQCAQMLRDVGFQTIRLSLESIDPGVINSGSGKVVRAEYAAAVKNLRDAGYSASDLETYVLLGLPGQSLDSVRDTISFVLNHGAKPKLAEFSPIPTTTAFAEAARTTLLLCSEPLLHNNSVYSTWVSGAISVAELQELKIFARSEPGGSG